MKIEQFKKQLEKISGKTRKILVVEMSYGQMVEDVRLAVDKKAIVGFYGRSGGGVPTEKQITREILKSLG